MSRIQVHDEVAAALQDGRAVVALETAVITHGLPREPMKSIPRCEPPEWDRSLPAHLALARSMAASVRASGAVPAFIAVLNGKLRIGLTAPELQSLSASPDVHKAASRDLAPLMAGGATAGTTVSATLAACRLAPHNPIRIMATGGIGGVHRDWQHRPDISADLLQLATTPVCIVCSGAKSLLDLPATFEVIESLAIPVLRFGTDQWPQFLSRGIEEFTASHRVDSAEAAAEICRLHWESVGNPSGVLVANPAPEKFAIEPDVLNQWIEAAESDADAAGVRGPDRTPFVLSRLAELSGWKSVQTNIALLIDNASLAARLAIMLATTR